MSQKKFLEAMLEAGGSSSKGGFKLDYTNKVDIRNIEVDGSASIAKELAKTKVTWFTEKSSSGAQKDYQKPVIKLEVNIIHFTPSIVADYLNKIS